MSSLTPPSIDYQSSYFSTELTEISSDASSQGTAFDESVKFDLCYIILRDCEESQRHRTKHLMADRIQHLTICYKERENLQELQKIIPTSARVSKAICLVLASICVYERQMIELELCSEAGYSADSPEVRQASKEIYQKRHAGDMRLPPPFFANPRPFDAKFDACCLKLILLPDWEKTPGLGPAICRNLEEVHRIFPTSTEVTKIANALSLRFEKGHLVTEILPLPSSFSPSPSLKRAKSFTTRTKIKEELPRKRIRVETNEKSLASADHIDEIKLSRGPKTSDTTSDELIYTPNSIDQQETLCSFLTVDPADDWLPLFQDDTGF